MLPNWTISPSASEWTAFSSTFIDELDASAADLAASKVNHQTIRLQLIRVKSTSTRIWMSGRFGRSSSLAMLLASCPVLYVLSSNYHSRSICMCMLDRVDTGLFIHWIKLFHWVVHLCNAFSFFWLMPNTYCRCRCWLVHVGDVME